MKQQPMDKETARYNAVAEMAGLLRESTQKRFSYMTGVDDQPTPTVWEYHNVIFSPEEHETVKRAFLRLISEL